MVLLLAVLQLAVQMVLDHLQQEDEFMEEPLMLDDDSESDGEVNTLEQETTLAVAHSNIESRQHSEEGWWVRERNMIWFDYYLWSAYEEERWVRTLRMPKELFTWLCSRLWDSVQKQNTRYRNAVPVEVRVGATLYRLATGSSYFATGEKFGIGESTCQEVVQETVFAIVRILGKEMIYWPGPVEMERISAQFFRKCGLPNCQGAIDGSHIQVRGSGGDQHQGDYSNRKQYYSIVLQAVVDADGVFLDTFVGFPGSCHDRRVLQVSPFYDNVKAGNFLAVPVIQINGDFQLPPYVLGDAGYTQEPWLMCPYNITSRSSARQRLFTDRQIRGRLVVEQSFGILKNRFRILDVGITLSISWAATLVQACCVLHNYLIRNRLQSLDRNIGDPQIHTGPRSGVENHSTESSRQGQRNRDALAEYLIATN